MRRVVDGIYEQQSAHRMDEATSGRDVVDRAERVRGGANRHEARARADGRFHRGPVELPGLDVHPDGPMVTPRSRASACHGAMLAW